MPGLGEQLPLLFGELDDEGNATNIEKLLRVWLSGPAGLEYSLQQLYLMRTVDTAVGSQLDVIGKLVGQKRGGLVDDVYRRYIRARIRANRSRGNVSDVLRVADLVIYDDDAYYHLINLTTGGFRIIVEGIVIDDYDVLQALVKFMRATASAGVRPVVETWPLEEEALMVFGGTGTTGDDAIGLGFGNELDADDGGGLASTMD